MVGPPSIEVRVVRRNGWYAMQDQPVRDHDSGAGCLTRLYWMFLGNALLVILFGLLLQNRPKGPSLLDAGCLIVVASLLFVRYIDIRHFNGQTGEGEPATLAHWRRYSAVLVSGSLALWLAVRLLAPWAMK